MAHTSTPKRPWLAVLLAVLGTGFGHLYLRRWMRAIGWVVVTVGVAFLFVPEAAIDGLLTGGEFAPLDVVPLVLVSAASTFDAYRLAVVNNYVVRLRERTTGSIAYCPECGRELDTDLAFCHWCSTRLPDRTTDATTDEEAEKRTQFPIE
jgi:hypothetical protein